MGLFDKKYCDICGEKIGLLGNKKLADGNMCPKCLKNASPYLIGRSNFTVDDMKEHFEYRTKNKDILASFNATSSFGMGVKIHIDEPQGLWLVTSSRSYKSENPDVMNTSQVTGCIIDVDETRKEMKFKAPDGTEKSFTPPRYDIDYDIYVLISINSPWFSEIKVKCNDSRIAERNSEEYRSAERAANDIKAALTAVHAENKEALKPKTSVVCPHCQATTLPDENGCCEYCGGAIG